MYLRHDFFATELSFSRLNTYLACKRKYYYRYILGIKEYRGFDKDISSHLGSTIHSALQEYFSKFKTKFVKKSF
ncbi:PD-(D/E)XK nuclease family protein [Campylobacter fetus subsp. fetus]|nr:PD-(D/E)XK nuclease family protein [Campylobacter fetus subsp. fetus]